MQLECAKCAIQNNIRFLYLNFSKSPRQYKKIKENRDRERANVKKANEVSQMYPDSITHYV